MKLLFLLCACTVVSAQPGPKAYRVLPEFSSQPAELATATGKPGAPKAALPLGLTLLHQPYMPPFSAISQLLIRHGSVISSCTGAPVGYFHIITAAHCLVDARGVKADEVWVIPAQTDVVAPFRSGGSFHNGDMPHGAAHANADGFRIFPKYYPAGGPLDLNYDIALIHVDRMIGKTVGKFGYEAQTVAPDFTFSAYPGGDAAPDNPALGPQDEIKEGNLFQYDLQISSFRYGRTPPMPPAAAGRLYVNFNAPYYHGMSGGPIWAPGFFIQGVASGKPRDTPAVGDPAWATSYDLRFTLITLEIFEQLNAWIRVDEAASTIVARPDLIENVQIPACSMHTSCGDPPRTGVDPAKFLRNSDVLTPVVAPGGWLEFTHSVRNVGPADSGQVSYDMYLSNDLNITTADFKAGVVNLGVSLPHGGFTVGDDKATPMVIPHKQGVSLPANTTPGEYYLGWFMKSTVEQYDNSPSSEWLAAGGPRLGEKHNEDTAVIRQTKVKVANLRIAASIGKLGFMVNGKSYTSNTAGVGAFQDYFPPGSQISLDVPTQVLDGIRFVFHSWSDGNLQKTRTLAAPAAFLDLSVNYIPQHLLTVTVNPPGSGTIEFVPPSPDGYYNMGTPVQITAKNSATHVFSSWGGIFTGSQNPRSLPMTGPRDIIANFAPCGVTLGSSGTSVTANYAAGTVTLAAATTGCVWNASSNKTWLQANPLSGAGNGSFAYTAFPNFSGTARSGTITVNGKTFTVTQAAGSGTADQRFARLLYFNFFGRLPSDAEIAFQLGSGQSKQQLAFNFLNSPEFNNAGRFVAGLYVGILNRDAEYGGWLFQRDALSRGLVNDTLVSNFLGAPEFHLRNGTLTDGAFVSLLYSQILGRTATAEEVQWREGVIKGGLTRVATARDLLSSTEFRIGKNARLLAFLFFATMLNREPTAQEFESKRGQIAANSSDAALLTQLTEIVNSAEFQGQFQ